MKSTDHLDVAREHARAERERERYNKGLDRRAYQTLFYGQTGHYYKIRRHEIVRQVMLGAIGHRVLELGCTAWVDWIDRRNIVAGELHCVNVSEAEVEKGRAVAAGRRNRPLFQRMDAHELTFENSSFDIVFGDAILHHLDLHRALDEIERVLAPGGTILFLEPLDLNPIARVVRWATPGARTEDEKPFRLAELRTLRQRFACTLHYEQLLSVPVGLVSRMIFASPANPLTYGAYLADRTLCAALPPLRPLFRNVLVEGRSRKTA